MKPDQIDRKRAMIKRLTLEECRGWWQAVFLEKRREPFAGEKQALEARADKLKGKNK